MDNNSDPQQPVPTNSNDNAPEVPLSQTQLISSFRDLKAATPPNLTNAGGNLPNNFNGQSSGQIVSEQTKNSTATQQVAPNPKTGFSKVLDVFVRFLKVIIFFVLGLFYLSVSYNKYWIQIPVGLIIGLLLLVISKVDKKIRIFILIVGFLQIVYSPFISQIFAQKILGNNVYYELKKNFPSALIGVQTIEKGIQIITGTEIKTTTSSLPRTLTLTITQDKLLSEQNVNEVASFLCANTDYEIVAVQSTKVPKFLIPLPFVSQTMELKGNCPPKKI